MFRRAKLSLQGRTAPNNPNVWNINSTALETHINQMDTLLSLFVFTSLFWTLTDHTGFVLLPVFVIHKGLGDFFLLIVFPLDIALIFLHTPSLPISSQNVTSRAIKLDMDNPSLCMP